MNMNKDARVLALELVDKFGRPNVRRQLVVEGCGLTTADRLARGVYLNVPRPLVAAAIVRAGIALKKAAA